MKPLVRDTHEKRVALAGVANFAGNFLRASILNLQSTAAMFVCCKIEEKSRHSPSQPFQSLVFVQMQGWKPADRDFWPQRRRGLGWVLN